MNHSRLALQAFVVLVSSGVAQSAESYSGTSEVFDLGRQSVVLGDTSLFSEMNMFRGLALREREGVANSLLPDWLVPIPDDFPTWKSFRARYQFNVLRPFAFQGALFSDELFVRSHSAHVQFRGSATEMVDWTVAAQGFYNQVLSNQHPDLNGDFTSEDNVRPISYGNEMRGSVALGASLKGWVDWRSQLYVQSKDAIDPSRAYVNGRNALAFPVRAQSSGYDLALLDKLDILSTGTFVKILHGANKPWNFSTTALALLEQRVYVKDLGVFAQIGSRNFNGFKQKFFEMRLGWMQASVASAQTELADALSAGGILSLSGFVRAGASGVNAFAVSAMAFGFKVDVTRQLRGIGDASAVGTGYGIGYSLAYEALDLDVSYYKNYLEHLDLVPAFKDTSMLRFNIGLHI